jgi:type VI secretion system VasD/TssJ family lipoprotein
MTKTHNQQFLKGVTRRRALTLLPLSAVGCSLGPPKPMPVTVEITAAAILNTAPVLAPLPPEPPPSALNSKLSVKSAAPVPPPRPVQAEVAPTEKEAAGASGTVSYPVSVRIFALRHRFTFDRTDFQSFVNDDATALGAALVTKWEFVVPPGGKVGFHDTVAPDTTFIGAIGVFRDPSGLSWRTGIEIEPGAKPSLVISLEGNTITVAPKKTGWF